MDVHAQLDLGIAIDATQSNAVDDTVENGTQSRAADLAKLETKSMVADIRGQQMLSGSPVELIGNNQRVS